MVDQLLYGTRKRRKDNADKWEELHQFIWNKVARHLLGRDAGAWMKLLAFYGLFYMSLMLMMVILLALALICMDDIRPYLTQDETPLQKNPGLAIRPAPDFQSGVVRFIQGKPQSYKAYADHVRTFLDQYENEAQVGENFIDCKHGRPPNSDQKVCRFDVNSLGGMCTLQRDYSYDEGQPCFILKLNRIYGWMPQTYSEAPDRLGTEFHPDYIGLSCEGENPADHENLGNMTFWPSRGFPKYFYPYLNQEGYRSPLVMVRFNNPTAGMLLNVACKAWAVNIKHNRNDMQGMVTFQLLVD